MNLKQRLISITSNVPMTLTQISRSEPKDMKSTDPRSSSYMVNELYYFTHNSKYKKG